MKPRCGSTIPEPPVCSIVSVYSTTLPHLSLTVRLDVDRPSWSSRLFVALLGGSHCPLYDETSPAGTGLVSAVVGSIWQARSRANRWESRSDCGTSTYAGSP